VTWRVTVDATVCIGSGVCAGSAPGRFRLDTAQRSTPVHALTEPDERIRDAAFSCPVEAITLTDAVTGEPVPLEG
jgi:ferredoxin